MNKPNRQSFMNDNMVRFLFNSTDYFYYWMGLVIKIGLHQRPDTTSVKHLVIYLICYLGVEQGSRVSKYTFR